MRNSMYAKINIAKKQLGMTDDMYRAMLQSNFKVSSSKDLSERQITKLLDIFVRQGVVFEAKKKTSKPRLRTDFVEITDEMPFASQKRQILAIWRKLGYKLSALDERVKREFGTPYLAWIKEEKQIIRILTDLQKREKAFDKKKADENLPF